MDTKDFQKLDPTIQISLMLAMSIRNEMEGFQAVHLSDEQMRELNPIIRQAIYNIWRYIDLASQEQNGAKKVYATKVINFQIGLIPDYWELPTEEVFQNEWTQIIQHATSDLGGRGGDRVNSQAGKGGNGGAGGNSTRGKGGDGGNGGSGFAGGGRGGPGGVGASSNGKTGQDGRQTK